MKNNILLIFSLVAVVSCGGNETSSSASQKLGYSVEYGDNCPYSELPIAIDANTTADEEAISLWNDEMGQEVFISDKDGVPIRVLDTFRGDDDNLLYGATSWQCIDGFKNPDMTEIVIKSYLSDSDYLETLTHELGHALGMNHTDFGIMQKSDINETVESAIYEMSDYFNELYK